MQPTPHVLEVALFTVKTAYLDQLPAIRAAVRAELAHFKGLISLECFTPINDSRVFADLARWESLEAAQVAADAFAAGDFRFLPYLDAIEEVQFMGHFQPQTEHPPLQAVV